MCSFQKQQNCLLQTALPNSYENLSVTVQQVCRLAALNARIRSQMLLLFYPGNSRKTDAEGLSCVVCDRFVVDVYIDLVADRNARTVIKEFLLDLIVDLAALFHVSDSRSFCNELIDLLVLIVVI